MKYTVFFEREADGGFVALVPLLRGCISQGDTRVEALANIREAMDVYIEDCLTEGDSVPCEGAIETDWHPRSASADRSLR